MTIHIPPTAPTGMTLFATATRLDDVTYWSTATPAFEASPSTANKKITLAEGTGIHKGTYYGSVSSTAFTGDRILIEIHDDNHPDDVVIASWVVRAVAGVEVDSADVTLWRGAQPNTLTSGRIDSTVGAMQTDVLDAAALKADAVTEIQTSVVGIATNIWGVGTSNFTTGGTVGKLILDNLNATVSSRSTLTAANVWDAATSGLTTSGSVGKRIVDNLNATVGGVPAAVWAVATSTLTAGGSIGKLLVDNVTASIAGVAAAVWAALTSGLTTSGSIGKLLVDRIDAAITSRLASGSYTAPPSAATVASQVLTDIGTAYGANFARLDVAVSTVGGGSAPSVEDVVAGITAEYGTQLGRLDATVSSRLAAADYVEPDAAAEVVAAWTTTYGAAMAHLDADVSSRLAASVYTPPPSVASIVDGVALASVADYEDESGTAVDGTLIGGVAQTRSSYLDLDTDELVVRKASGAEWYRKPVQRASGSVLPVIGVDGVAP